MQNISCFKKISHMQMLERSNKGLELSPQERAQVSSFLEFCFHNLFVDLGILINERTIRGNVSLLYTRDSDFETLCKAKIQICISPK